MLLDNDYYYSTPRCCCVLSLEAETLGGPVGQHGSSRPGQRGVKGLNVPLLLWHLTLAAPPPPKLQLTLVINLLQLPQIIEQLLGYIVVKIGICLLFPTMSLSNCMLSDSEWCF